MVVRQLNSMERTIFPQHSRNKGASDLRCLQDWIRRHHSTSEHRSAGILGLLHGAPQLKLSRTFSSAYDTQKFPTLSEKQSSTVPFRQHHNLRCHKLSGHFREGIGHFSKRNICDLHPEQHKDSSKVPSWNSKLPVGRIIPYITKVRVDATPQTFFVPRRPAWTVFSRSIRFSLDTPMCTIQQQVLGPLHRSSGRSTTDCNLLR